MESIIQNPTKVTSGEPLVETKTYCLYARKSTESDEKQTLSIDSQVKEMIELANKQGLNVVDIKRESHSAKATGQRPVFNELIQGIRDKKYNGIIAWAPDRLSRNAGDLGAIVDLMDQDLIVEIRTHGQTFTNNPNEKFLLMILGSQAKLENDQKGKNVQRGLRARCEMGLWPSVPPTGYLSNPDRNKKCEVIIDPKRAPVIKQMFEKVAYESWSGRKVYKWLIEIDFKTKSGKHLTLSNIYLALSNHFHYGTFEFPKKSNTWYQGKHEPIVTKELFDTVQNIIKQRYVPKTESKEFAFTKLIKCGLCGSGITADEKFKKLKDGSVNRHVYYLCTKSRDINCKNKYINEQDLIKKLFKLIDTVELNELGVQEHIERELERYNRFRTGVLGIEKEKQSITDLDIRNYMKYILRDGTIFEKREMLINLSSQLILKDKNILLLQ